MGEHSTDELRCQRGDALDRLNKARAEFGDAKEAHEAAMCADRLAEYAKKGIVPGSKAVHVSKHWRVGEVRRVVSFIGVEILGSDVRDVLGGIKKDGTPSKARKNFPHGTLEPFEGSPEKKKGAL